MTNPRLFRMKSFRSKWWSSVDLKSTSEAAADNVASGPVVLQKINRPDLENLRHRENSLKLWIFEAKRLPTAKKRYYCEICLDHILYARTTSKEKTQDADPFWGESFEFNNLQDLALVTIRLYRETAERSKRHKKASSSRASPGVATSATAAVGNRREPLGEVELAAQDIRSPVERWFTLQLPSQSQQAQQQQPSLRIRAHFLSVDVLPLRCYRGLHQLAAGQPLALVKALEPKLQLRAKEDLAARLISIAHSAGSAESLLADLTVAELTSDPTLLFRGNSVATKAVEFYLKLTGAGYLRSVLGQPLSALLTTPGDQQPVPQCEIDPQRVPSPDQLAVNQRNLITLVESFWLSIRSSADLVPPEVARFFAIIRRRLADAGRSELGDNLISGSVFLRLICPAILGPSLFGLCTELPAPRAARALTLVAKAIQHLANGAEPFGSKEPHMRFMNRFIQQQAPSMRLFLRAASRPAPRNSTMARDQTAVVVVDLGYELAQLHCLLNGCLATSAVKQDDGILVAVEKELVGIDRCLETEGVTHADYDAGDGTGRDDGAWVYSNVSDYCPGTSPPLASVATQLPQQQQLHQLHEDWQRVLDEAQSFTTTTGSSSGYQSFTPAAAIASVTAATGSAESPVQFYNPSYQQNDKKQPPDYEPRRESFSSDLAGSSEASIEPAAAARLKSLSLGPTSASCGMMPTGGGDMLQNGGRVRMGIRARQHQPQSQTPQPSQPLQQLHQPSPASPSSQSNETDLQKLQRELTETRRRLQATEARLRSNETEKAQLMAQFQQHHHQRHQKQPQPQQQQMSRSSTESAANGDRQMLEIMHRLRSLESSLQRQSIGPTASSAVPKAGSCLRGN